MEKDRMSDALDSAEAYVKQQRRHQRLEAAAPDLLAALQNLVAEFDNFSRYGSLIAIDEAMRDARAAISCATGDVG
jgi:hypothetical protein